MNEWIEVNTTWRDFEHREPGTLVEMESGEQYLIGEINTLGGVCDDCMMFKYDDRVRRYKVLLEKDW